MSIQITKTEKLLIIAIMVVVGAILGSLYWGVSIIKNNTHLVQKTTLETNTDISETPQVDVELTQKQKLQVLKDLNTGSNTLIKQDRLDLMKKNQTDTKESATLTVSQKMDVLSGL